MQKTITQRKSIRAIVANSFVQIGYPIYALMRIRRKPWTYTVEDYLNFTEGSLGHDIGKFLKDNGFSPLARAEFHDVYHILFQLNTTMKDETTIQFIVMGNGKLSAPNILSSLVALVFYPEYWNPISMLGNVVKVHDNFIT